MSVKRVEITAREKRALISIYLYVHIHSYKRPQEGHPLEILALSWTFYIKINVY
jgi:hypothetical protein